MTTDKTIDLARAGLSKSLMTTPCERKGFYTEAVRDDDGKRLSFPMPERVIFGRFVDAAHAYVVQHDSRGLPWATAEAFRLGMENAKQTEASEPIDEEVFAIQAANAIQLLIDQPDGLARMRELYPLHLRAQGDNGKSLRRDDIIGTPDYLFDTGLVDVKTAAKTYPASKFWRSAEMPVYADLWSAWRSGELPSRLIYHVYVRKAKPEWVWLEYEGSVGDLINLGRHYEKRWRRAMEEHDPDLFSFDTTFCGDCPFRNPMPEYGFDGCPVGAVVPMKEAAA